MRIQKRMLLATAALALSLTAASGLALAAEAASEQAPNLDAAQWADVYPNEYDSWMDNVNLDYAHAPDVDGKASSHTTCIMPPEGYPFDFMPACLACHSTQVLELTEEYGDGWGRRRWTPTSRPIRS